MKSERYRLLEEELLASPCVSDWLKNAIRRSLERDQVDALRDAELLVKLIERRLSFVQKKGRELCVQR